MRSLLHQGSRFVFWSGLLWMGMLVWLNDAQAQYKHHGLGIIAGSRYTFNVEGDPASNNLLAQRGYGVSAAYLSLGIDYQYRFTNNWIVAVEAAFSFHACNAGQAGPNAVCVRGEATPLMLTANTGLRYLFLTDDFRPYVGFGIGYWQSLAFVQQNLSSFGPTAEVGFEWFFKEELSLGVRIRYGLLLLIGENNISPFHELSGGIVFNAYL
jgi:outer membrane protein W